MARGVYSDAGLRTDFADLPPPDHLADIDKAAALLADAIMANEKILIVGDYDADGALSVVLALKALKDMSAQNTDYVIPHRVRDGYGLTGELAKRLTDERSPCLVLTVDNGIRSHAAAELFKQKNFRLIITDHHLPEDRLPPADAIVNPNRSDCPFPAKNLAGVGVCFYLMCHLRRLLRERRYFLYRGVTPPNMAKFLDLVALGTLADMVPMDKTNRILTQRGLDLIRAGKTRPGIKMLLNHRHRYSDAVRLVFNVIPVLNAAGRMEDMSLAVDFLAAELPATAEPYHKKLQSLNRLRRQRFAAMRAEAEKMPGDAPTDGCLCFADASWHVGLTGVLAGSLSDEHSCPVVVFAGEGLPDDILRASARTPASVRADALFEEIRTAKPGLLLRYGGHKHAAGISIRREHLDQFKAVFKQVVAKQKTASSGADASVLTDGSLPIERMTRESARLLAEFIPWGQEFPPPLFDDEFTLLHQEHTATGTLKLKLKRAEAAASDVSAASFVALKFRHSAALYPLKAKKVRLVYSLLSEPQFNGGGLVLKTQYLEELS